ncbi:MAG: 2-oxoacid:acceptor oxidoreductase subunit alpha, partial [Myxococcales bacterium]|nr:2-oxoacid:acceptor oxidoreductase subunit alpha [Myxococcales bacterium]
METPATRAVETRDRVVVRFAGDSGDGIQLTGSQFTQTAAVVGNDLATFPDFPAEIRAPAGTLPGVSGFQIHFSSEDIYTPGDAPDVLVAMNPAALKVNINDLKSHGICIVNTDKFKANDLRKAGYDADPLDDGSLDGFRTFKVPLGTLTKSALENTGLNSKDSERCKNFFALGMMYYLYNRSLDHTEAWLETKFKSKPEVLEANVIALRAGWSYCEASELFQTTYEVPRAKLEPGLYRSISGNSALCHGLLAASMKSGMRLFLGSYPITPASDILHQLAGYKNFGVMTFQAEDEIAAIGAALGASYSGVLGLTTTSGPGMALKGEFLGLAIMVELPLVVINIQRGGPSTGLPTKTEQADLLQALYGRNSEAPCIVIAARSPADCFETAFEACQLSLEHMTPVVFLSDGFIANGSEPWKIPDADALPPIGNALRTDVEGFQPYLRDERTLARPWAVPGTPGLEHRVGGLEKEDMSGNVSYDPLNHEQMCRVRAEKVRRVADRLPLAVPDGFDAGGVLVLGWGSTYGAITAATRRARAAGIRASHLHLRHLFPFPKNLEEVLRRYDHVLIPELNLGQLSMVVRAQFLLEVQSLNKVQGQPFKESEI